MLAYKLKALEACLFPACHIWSQEDKDGVEGCCQTLGSKPSSYFLLDLHGSTPEPGAA